VRGAEVEKLPDERLLCSQRPPIAIGDIVSLGISHPCTRFDKWDVLYGVDDSYNIIEAFKTYF
jgi:D-serine dehydratase